MFFCIPAQFSFKVFFLLWKRKSHEALADPLMALYFQTFLVCYKTSETELLLNSCIVKQILCFQGEYEESTAAHVNYLSHRK